VQIVEGAVAPDARLLEVGLRVRGEGARLAPLDVEDVDGEAAKGRGVSPTRAT
jgi:hypothetical protein